jgi:hypothetical protein
MPRNFAIDAGRIEIAISAIIGPGSGPAAS